MSGPGRPLRAPPLGAVEPVPPRRILVVEDDPDLSRLLDLHLSDAGWKVDVASDGAEGRDRALGGGYDLIILDLTLPRVDGLDVCRALRERSAWVPVLMLTARSTEVDRVLGLEVGADDYLSKPFGMRELVARVRAIFRRVEAAAGKSARRVLEAGALSIDESKRRVLLRGRPVELTAREFDLLSQFARHPGRVFTRAELLEVVWGYGHEGYSHTVNTHINRLRAKIEDDPARPRYIRTVWGVGYRFRDGGEDE
jgi:two-component system, OmpR family, alkaline phosphatase synthesis response regulator PhoP